jgi:hypothetical protein
MFANDRIFGCRPVGFQPPPHPSQSPSCRLWTRESIVQVTRSLAGLPLALLLLATAPAAQGDESEIPAPATIPASGERKIEIIVDADEDGALLERRVNTVEGWQATLGIPVYSSTQQWEPACVAPCKLKVDADSAYRVSGEGIATSRTFTLPALNDPLKLHVHGRSAFLYGAGQGLTTVGTVFVLFGGISTLYSKSITSTDAEESLRSVGVAVLITGAVFVAVGLPLWLSGKSTVRTDGGQRVAGSLQRLFTF